MVSSQLSEDKNCQMSTEKMYTVSLPSEQRLVQPQVFVHRDYHSRNLMKIDANWPGIIDYQDAVCGPVTYDAVSLLRDCYIQWSPDRVKAWALEYKERLMETNMACDVSDETFLKWFDLMGIQRH